MHRPTFDLTLHAELTTKTRYLSAALGWLISVVLAGCGGDALVDGDVSVVVPDAQLDGVGGPDTHSDTLSDGVEAPDTIADTVSDIAADVSEPLDIGGERVVTLTVVVPPETPRDAVVTVASAAWDGARPTDCGAATNVCVVRVTVDEGRAGAWTATLVDVNQVFEPLLAAGNPMGDAMFDATADTATLTVERWGPAEGASRFGAAFLVTPPPTTPPFEDLFIVGDAVPLGAWDGRGVRLRPARNGLHAAWLDVPDRRSVAFKVTRGSWYTVEKGASGEEIANRQLDLGAGIARAFISPASWSDIVQPGTGTLSGDVRLFRAVPSAYLDEARDVLVWLPPAYRNDGDTRFPAMLLHDGQNMMDAWTAFGGVEWGVDETLGTEIDAGRVEPLIAVAIGNSSARIDEYTPTVDASVGGGGKASAYGMFLTTELLPLLRQHLRISHDSADLSLVGSSLGGLVSLWLGLEFPGHFGRLGVVSPSVWWDGRVILSVVAGLEPGPRARVWLDIGTAEGSGGSAVTNTEALRDALIAEGWVAGENLQYQRYDGAGHNESAWRARFGEIARWLHPGP
jgi:predicted alpha/beta superfamily hydrolase